MKDSNRLSGLLITARYAIRSTPGGVQRCTYEYVQTLRAAGVDVEELVYDIDRRPLTRLKRKFFPRPYANLVDPAFARQAAARIAQRRPDWVFFNQIEAAPLVHFLHHTRTPTTRFGLLSHGVDSSDFLHSARVISDYSTRSSVWLGRQLFAEQSVHEHFDLVFCLSETDRAFHQWLGGKAVHILPRAIVKDPLDWRPVANRCGTVGTLDHAPNVDGISQLAGALLARKSTVELRLVGRPEHSGRQLAAKYPNIRYQGPLSDSDFAAEASTWSVFVNPIFCYPRGCSTKLAVPIGWHLPVASTRAGARGYWWDESLVPLAESPSELAAMVDTVAKPPHGREKIVQLCERSPTVATIGQRVRELLTANAVLTR